MIKGRTALIPKARTQKVKMALKLRAKGRHTHKACIGPGSLQWLVEMKIICRLEEMKGAREGQSSWVGKLDAREKTCSYSLFDGGIQCLAWHLQPSACRESALPLNHIFSHRTALSVCVRLV